jgi:hypothetical protein
LDKSKLPKQTRKSDETPWTPTHERKKLSDRAGTVFDDSHKGPFGIRRNRQVRNWAGGEEGDKAKEAASHENESGWSVTRSGVTQGKKKSGAPVSRNKWNVLDKPKKKNEEREY